MAVQKLTPEEVQNRKLTAVKAEEFFTAYANNVSIQLSPWDLRLLFGRVQSASADELVIENQAEIYMSPQHAKAFLKILQEHVQNYETTFGFVNDPNA